MNLLTRKRVPETTMTNDGVWRLSVRWMGLLCAVSLHACAIDDRTLQQGESLQDAGADARVRSPIDASAGRTDANSVSTEGGSAPRDGAPAANDGAVVGVTDSSARPRDGAIVVDGGATGDGSLQCGPAEKTCNGQCVLVSDPAYGCGVATCSAAGCPAAPDGGALVCQGGACVVGSCGAGQKKCGTSCVAIDDATYGCGATSCDKTSCPSAVSATLICAAGACVIGTCGPGTKKCGGQCVAITDPTYGCGATCDATLCPDPGASGTLTCSGGACVIGACAPGTKKCGNKCVPVDRNNGCSDPAQCTACAVSEACVGTPAVCKCVANNDACTLTSKNCGSVLNNCGEMVSCGTCTAPKTCMGGGVANQCGCTPVNPCVGGACGTALADKCGGTVNCGCSGGATCGGGGVPGICGTPPLTRQGQLCTSAAACASGRCVDGVCCAAASCGTCMKCNLNGLGTCAAVAAGTADPACPASAANCMAGGCSGSGATCRAAALGTSCGKTCSNGSEPPGGGQYSGPATTLKVCNGTVAGPLGCVAANNTRAFCDNGALCADATNCRAPATCATQAECAEGYYCSAGLCTSKKLDGELCDNPFECRSRVCTGTRDNRTPHCALCTTAYNCPHDRPFCSPNTTCEPCNGAVTECYGGAVAPHANGTISCSTASCPANATDCDSVTDECHCGASTQCDAGQVCVNSQCKVAPLWPCVSNDCGYGTCTNGVCPQGQARSFCTRLQYPIDECAVGTCQGLFVAPAGSSSFGTSACGP